MDEKAPTVGDFLEFKLGLGTRCKIPKQNARRCQVCKSLLAAISRQLGGIRTSTIYTCAAIRDLEMGQEAAGLFEKFKDLCPKAV